MKKKSSKVKHVSVPRKNHKELDATTKILFYIAVSDMADNVKKSWATLIPHMTDAQKRRLLTILESSFLDKATSFVDEHLSAELKRIQQKYAPLEV